MNILKERSKSSKKILDVGCGKNKFPGSTGVDINPKSDADIVTDIEKKLPFPQNSFDLIYSSHTLEHISPKKLVFILEEIWRVTKPQGEIFLTVPHFSGAGSYTNPTHQRMGFSSQTFNFFDSKEYQGKAKFQIKKITLKKGKTRNYILNFIIRFIDKLANLNPLFCELSWVYWVGGFHEIQFRLKPIKKN